MNLKQFCEQNWFYLKDRIDWEWDRYWDGIPSVTTILTLIVDPVFEYIKRNNSEQIDEAAKRWKRVHANAEKHSIEWNMDVDNSIVEFHTIFDITTIHVEKKYEKDIQWTIDLVWYVWWRQKGIHNIDYKSSVKNKNKKYKLQLTWYKYLNWYNWLLAYVEWKKLKHEFVDCDEYMEAFLELKDLFFKLLKANDNLHI